MKNVSCRSCDKNVDGICSESGDSISEFLDDPYENGDTPGNCSVFNTAFRGEELHAFGYLILADEGACICRHIGGNPVICFRPSYASRAFSDWDWHVHGIQHFTATFPLGKCVLHMVLGHTVVYDGYPSPYSG